MKVLITGSIDYPDLELVKDFVKKLSSDTIVINGRREGVDNVVRNQAVFQDLIVIDKPVTIRPERFAKVIDYLDLVDEVDEVHIFWTGRDPKIQRLIDYAEYKGKLMNCILDGGEKCLV